MRARVPPAAPGPREERCGRSSQRVSACPALAGYIPLGDVARGVDVRTAGEAAHVRVRGRTAVLAGPAVAGRHDPDHQRVLGVVPALEAALEVLRAAHGGAAIV